MEVFLSEIKYLELNILRLLFSMAPILKLFMAAILNIFKSYSKLYFSSSHFIACSKQSKAKFILFLSSFLIQIFKSTLFLDLVINLRLVCDSLPATKAKR